MSYNPRVHVVGERRARRPQRVVDPRLVGTRHSDLTRRNGPVGVSHVDIQNKIATTTGWRIPYFSGDTFEVYYELICARNASGKLRHETMDRCVRVLAGQLFITHGGQITNVLTNQVCSIPHGEEYEIASSGDSDVEILVIQGRDYEKDLIHITEPEAVSNKAVAPFIESAPTTSRIDPAKAEQAALRLQEERAARERNKNKRSPVPKRANEISLPGSSPAANSAPGGRIPLAGQQIVGVNPRPLGAAGFGEE